MQHQLYCTVWNDAFSEGVLSAPGFHHPVMMNVGRQFSRGLNEFVVQCELSDFLLTQIYRFSGNQQVV